MEKRLMGVTLALALFASGVAAADRPIDKLKYPPLKDLSIPQVEKVTLDNGLVVYLLEDHTLPVFNISARMKAGSYLESADKIGAAELTGTVMRTGGTAKMSGDEIDEKLEAVGASVEASIGLTEGSASGRSLIEYADLTLDVFADVLMSPAFDEDKLVLAKTEARSDISRRNDSPQPIANRTFNVAIYGKDSPYSRWPEYATIDAVTREDLQTFHRRFIHPKNLQLALWGDFNKAEMLEKVKSRFAAWSSASGEVAPEPPAVTAPSSFSRVLYAPKSDVNQSNFYIGHLGGRVQDSAYPTRLVMNNVFGGGFNSRLFSNVRTREGLAYATGGGFNANLSYMGRFFGFASTKSETTLKAMKEVIKQMELMRSAPPTQQEISSAIDAYNNSFVFNFDTRGEVVNRLMAYDAYGLPADYLNRVKAKVEKVTPAAVHTQAQNDFQTDKLQYVVCGKGEDFDGKLSDLGHPVDTIDIAIPEPEPKEMIDPSAQNIAKARQTLAAAVKATGGQAAYNKIKSFEKKANVTFFVQGQGMAMTASEIIELPNRSNSTINTPMGAMKNILNGQEGWRAMGPQVQPLSEREIADESEDLSRNFIWLFQNVANPNITPVYGGKGEENGVAVDYVHFLGKDGKAFVRVGFDATTALPVCQRYQGMTQAGPSTITVFLSDFRESGGIKTAFASKSFADGQPMLESTITEFKVNAPIPVDAFSKPQ